MNRAPSTDGHRSTLHLAFTALALMTPLRLGRDQTMIVRQLAALIPLLTAVTVALSGQLGYGKKRRRK